MLALNLLFILIMHCVFRINVCNDDTNQMRNQL